MSKAREIADLGDVVTVDSTGNVGIGTSSPLNPLDVVETDTTAEAGTVASFRTGAGGYFYIQADDKSASNPTWNIGAATNEQLAFSANNTEAMRIDSSGNLLVGKTSFDASVSGMQLDQSGEMVLTRTGGCFVANRIGSDGGLLTFKREGTTVGSIGSNNSSRIYIGSGETNLTFNDSAGGDYIFASSSTGAGRDNVIDLGNNTVRFDDIYATNGTIQTSDRNEKQDITSLTPTEMLVAARLSTGFKNFRWKDSVAEKGAEARMHSGAIAQDVQDAFTAEGLDAGDYSMFISSTWWKHDVEVPAVEAVAEVVDEYGVVVTEAVEAVAAYTRTDTYDTEAEAPEGAVAKTRLGVRYPELLSFVAAYNEQRFASIEARLTALETV